MNTVTVTIKAEGNKFNPNGCPRVFNGKDIKILGTKNITPQFPTYLFWQPFDSSEIMPDDTVLVTHIMVDNVSYYIQETIVELLDSINLCCIEGVLPNTNITLSVLKAGLCVEDVNNFGVYTIFLKLTLDNKDAISNTTIFNISDVNSLGIPFLYEASTDPSYDISNNSIVVLDAANLPLVIPITGTILGSVEGCQPITGTFSLTSLDNTNENTTYTITGSPLSFSN